MTEIAALNRLGGGKLYIYSSVCTHRCTMTNRAYFTITVCLVANKVKRSRPQSFHKILQLVRSCTAVCNTRPYGSVECNVQLGLLIVLNGTVVGICAVQSLQCRFSTVL